MLPIKLRGLLHIGDCQSKRGMRKTANNQFISKMDIDKHFLEIWYYAWYNRYIGKF